MVPITLDNLLVLGNFGCHIFPGFQLHFLKEIKKEEKISSACWVIFHDFLLSADFFLKLILGTLSVSNRSGSVGPDLGPNCLQR